MRGMTISPLTNLAQSYLPSILGSGLQQSLLTTGSNLANSGLSSIGMPSDNGGLSPFAQMLTTLQQLQQTNPAEYQQVTQQISTNLQTASQAAQSQGNTAAASRLSTLATDFSKASQSSQLPNIQDLGKLFSGHHHQGTGAADGDGDGSSSTSSTGSTTGATNALSSQATSAFLASLTQSEALNPTSIIMNTLSGAGVSNSIY